MSADKANPKGNSVGSIDPTFACIMVLLKAPLRGHIDFVGHNLCHRGAHTKLAVS